MKRQAVTRSLDSRLQCLRPTGTALKRFSDGHQVRLRNVGRNGMYLVADEDGVAVLLSPLRESFHAAWQVHRVVRGKTTNVLLHGAAFGRYLKATNDPAPSGHIGHNVVQGVYDDDNAVAWVPVEVGTGGEDRFLLKHKSDRLLRANGKYCRWRTGVSVDDDYNGDTMMHWVVEDVSPSPGLPTPDLPHPAQASPQGAFWTKFFCRAAAVEEEQRIVRFVQATDDWSFDPNGWKEIVFRGRSVLGLKSALTRELGQGNAVGIELRVQAGRLGHLTPLHINLPRDDKPMDVVALCTFAPSDEFHEEPLTQLELEMESPEEVPREPDAVEFHEPLRQDELEMNSQEEVPREPDDEERTKIDRHGKDLASPSVSGRLDPEVVHFYCINGSVEELLRYIDSIPGSNHDPECKNIHKYAIQLRKVGPAVTEGESMSDKLKKEERRKYLAHEASRSARQSKLLVREKARGQEDKKRCNVEAAGEALGEAPSIGIIAAAQRMQDTDFVLQNFLLEDNQIEAKHQTLKERYQNLQNDEQEQNEERKQKLLKQIEKSKTKMDNRKFRRSILEQEAHNAKVQYEREVLRSQQ